MDQVSQLNSDGHWLVGGDFLETVDQDQMSTVTKVKVLSSQKYSSQTMVVISVCSSLPTGTWCQDAWSVFHPELTSL